MTDPPEEKPGTVFQPLKSKQTRTESVEQIGGQEAAPQKTFEGLKAQSTRTEYVEAEDATPLVVVDDEQKTPEEDGRTLPELLGRVRDLQSRNMILRTERTSIAGRKYALEVVIETLREKLEAVAELCDRLDAPGELGEALREIKEMVGDAKRIASSKAVLEEDLEAERAKHLEERQAFEQKTFELNQELTGAKSERDTLRGLVSNLERERLALQAQIEDEKRSVSEVETHAVEQLESYQSQISELEARATSAESEAETLKVARDEAVDALEEAVQHSEDVTKRVNSLEAELIEAREQLVEAADRTELEAAQSDLEIAKSDLQVVQADLEVARGSLDAANARAETQAAKAQQAESRAKRAQDSTGELKQRLDELEAKVGRQKATLEEQLKALMEMKPILEDWTKLEKENDRLSRLVGEARKRGRVNIQEIMARAALLKKLEKLTSQAIED